MHHRLCIVYMRGDKTTICLSGYGSTRIIYLQQSKQSANAHMSIEQPIPMMPTPSVRTATTHMLSKPEPDCLHRCDSANRFTTPSLKPTNERARWWCEAEMYSEALQEGPIKRRNSVSLCREHNMQTQAIPLIKRDSDDVDDVDAVDDVHCGCRTAGR